MSTDSSPARTTMSSDPDDHRLEPWRPDASGIPSLPCSCGEVFLERSPSLLPRRGKQHLAMVKDLAALRSA